MWRFGESQGRTIRTVGALSAVGLSFVLAVVMGAGAGYVVDRWLGSLGIPVVLFSGCRCWCPQRDQGIHRLLK